MALSTYAKTTYDENSYVVIAAADKLERTEALKFAKQADAAGAPQVASALRTAAANATLEARSVGPEHYRPWPIPPYEGFQEALRLARAAGAKRCIPLLKPS